LTLCIDLIALTQRECNNYPISKWVNPKKDFIIWSKRHQVIFKFRIPFRRSFATSPVAN